MIITTSETSRFNIYELVLIGMQNMNSTKIVTLEIFLKKLFIFVNYLVSTLNQNILKFKLINVYIIICHRR